MRYVPDWKVCLSSVVFAAGCASAPLPADRLASSEAAVRSAKELGAPNTPTAALHLKLAQENVDRAKQLINDGDNERADFVLMRAEADAELALALAKEASAQTDAQQMADKIKNMRGMPGTAAPH